jgi:uncharacterized membrane protein
MAGVVVVVAIVSSKARVNNQITAIKKPSLAQATATATTTTATATQPLPATLPLPATASATKPLPHAPILALHRIPLRPLPFPLKPPQKAQIRPPSASSEKERELMECMEYYQKFEKKKNV